MSGTRPHLAVQGETGTAQQNHPNRFLCLLSSAYADSFTGSTSVTPACSEPLLKKSLTVHQITYKIPISYYISVDVNENICTYFYNKGVTGLT